MTRVAAIVLAAGQGKRFGGPKQLATVGGQTLVARAVAAASASTLIDPVLVVVGSGAEDVRAAVPPGRHRFVTCDGWAEGIAASLRRGLEAAGEVDAVLVLLADQPLVDGALVRSVLSQGLPRIATRTHDVARPFYEGVPGHPVLLGPAAVRRGLMVQGDRGLGAVLVRSRVFRVSVEGRSSTLDVDRPEDLAVARHELDQSGDTRAQDARRAA